MKLCKWFVAPSVVLVVGAIWFVAQPCRSHRRESIPRLEPVLVDTILANPGQYYGKNVKLVCYLYTGEGAALLPVPFGLPDTSDIKASERTILAKISNNCREQFLNEYQMDFAEVSNQVILVEGEYHRSGYQAKGHLLEDCPYVAVNRIQIPNVTWCEATDRPE